MQSKIKIKLETKLNKFMESDHDDRYKKGGIFEGHYEDELTPDLDNSFHNALHKYIENHLVEFDETFENEMLDLISDEGWDLSVKPIKELGDLGSFSLYIDYYFAKDNKSTSISKSKDNYIKSKLKEIKAKTKVYGISSISSNDEIAIVKWHPAWRKYCLFPTIDFETVLDEQCLLSLARFLHNLNSNHQKKKK